MCNIQWLVGEDEDLLTKENEDFQMEDVVVEADPEADQFISIISTLTWLQPRSDVKNFTVGCR